MDYQNWGKSVLARYDQNDVTKCLNDYMFYVWHNRIETVIWNRLI